MTGPTLPERLRDAGLSTWELGDLLGTWSAAPTASR